MSSQAYTIISDMNHIYWFFFKTFFNWKRLFVCWVFFDIICSGVPLPQFSHTSPLNTTSCPLFPLSLENKQKPKIKQKKHTHKNKTYKNIKPEAISTNKRTKNAQSNTRQKKKKVYKNYYQKKKKNPKRTKALETLSHLHTCLDYQRA